MACRGMKEPEEGPQGKGVQEVKKERDEREGLWTAEAVG